MHSALTFLGKYKSWILITSIITAGLVSIIVAGNRLQEQFLANFNRRGPDNPLGFRIATRSAETTSAPLPTISETSVLGITDDEDIRKPVVYPTLFVLPTDAPFVMPTPYPTSAPVPTTAPLNCAGTANEDKSQVYVSPSTVSVGSSSTVSIELRDCNKALASDDNLSVILQTNDPTARINGQAFPMNLKAQNGKASFTVTSQTAGTITMRITDTNQNFPVTMPGYKNPAVTFTNNTSGNPNCTTNAGIPNSWYSDVYPNNPINTSSGSVELSMVLRDCNKATAQVSDTIRISLLSGDASAKINGNALPYQLNASNGEVKFTVSSAVSGTVTLKVEDTTRSFTVTNTSNANPSISFTGASANPTPAPTAQATGTPTSSPTGTAPSPTPTGESPTPTPSLAP